MTNYDLMRRQLISLSEGCRKPLPVLANCAALLWHSLEDINWAGFYLLSGNKLYLAPFQGKTACTVIPVGRGVCGTAAATGELQLVPDVHQFPGHIACDSASRSELVIPLFHGGQLLGVLDIDSPIENRFTQRDAEELSLLCRSLEAYTDWENGLI